MYRKFASITHRHEAGIELAYAIDTEKFDIHAPFNAHFRVYQTYGDGLTAHSPDWSVNISQITDFLISLAVTMQDACFDRLNFTAEDADQFMQHIVHDFLREPAERDIEFAASLKFRETDRDWGKRRYYSVKERKLSSSAAKEHDKRFCEMAEWIDGSAKAIYRLVIPDYADDLQRLLYAKAIHEWCIRGEDRPWCPWPIELLNWFKGESDQREKGQALMTAVDACICFARSYQNRHAGISQIGNYTRNYARSAEKAGAL